MPSPLDDPGSLRTALAVRSSAEDWLTECLEDTRAKHGTLRVSARRKVLVAVKLLRQAKVNYNTKWNQMLADYQERTS